MRIGRRFQYCSGASDFGDTWKVGAPPLAASEGLIVMGRRMVPSSAFLAICAGDSGIWNTLDAPSLQPLLRILRCCPGWSAAIVLEVADG
jgi:hypothetical protein